MSVPIAAVIMAPSSEQRAAECACAMWILTHERLPTELRHLIIKADFKEHITSSIDNARSPLFFALRDPIKKDLLKGIHKSICADIMDLWAKQEKATYHVPDEHSLKILDSFSRKKRLSIEHIMFNKYPSQVKLDYGFPPSLAGQKITLSNNLRTIHFSVPEYDRHCIELFRSYDLGGRLHSLIPAAKATLEKVVIELPLGRSFESCPDKFWEIMKVHVNRLNRYVGTNATFEASPSGALFLVWTAPFDHSELTRDYVF